MVMFRHKGLQLFCLTSALALGIAFLLRGNMLQEMLYISISLLCLFTLLILSFLWIFFYIKKDPKTMLLKSCLLYGVVCFLPQYPALLVGRYLLQQDVNEAKKYCEQWISYVEEYQIKNKTYPTTLPLSSKKIPPLLKDREYYRIENGVYYFYFQNPGELMSDYEFDSQKKVWKKG